MGGVISAGILLYLIFNKFFQYIWDTPAEAGRGFSQIGKIPFDRLINLIKNCYIYTWQYFFGNTMINNYSGDIKKCVINAIWFVIAIIIVVWKIGAMKKEKAHKILALIEIVLFPVAIMCITIAANDVSIYKSTGMIMLPTTNYVYIFPLLLLHFNNEKKYFSRMIRFGMYTVSLVLVIMLFNFSSAMQMYQKACLQKINYVAENITKEIEKYIYQEGKYSVCVVGKMENGNYPERLPALAEQVRWTTSSYGMVWVNYEAIQVGWSSFVEQYFGVSYTLCDFEQYNEIIQTYEYKTAGCFLNEGSVFLYDDSIVVVKLSDPI